MQEVITRALSELNKLDSDRLVILCMNWETGSLTALQEANRIIYFRNVKLLMLTEYKGCKKMLLYPNDLEKLRLLLIMYLNNKGDYSIGFSKGGFTFFKIMEILMRNEVVNIVKKDRGFRMYKYNWLANLIYITSPTYRRLFKQLITASK